MSLINKPAPTDLTLKNQDGEDVCLGDFVGKKPTIIFFYPKDETYGCTKEFIILSISLAKPILSLPKPTYLHSINIMSACSFRDSHSVFSEAGAIVVGISADSPESHKRFAENQNLPYQLLSDPNGEAKKAFGVSDTFGFLPGRVTYLINREGIVQDVFSSQLDFKGHAKKAVEFIKSHA
ncbi:2656_t:CDS:2 [Dentiscutata heterogama]|uniref:2656_t:CDS:1 n=1 Tax=Dentiscutata heterogama TaxID=1316150 RepID=A0ACA9K4F0_9GLOM|nr:2656_t:CDS:2 [Dentiscutata heterogama]